MGSTSARPTSGMSRIIEERPSRYGGTENHPRAVGSAASIVGYDRRYLARPARRESLEANPFPYAASAPVAGGRGATPISTRARIGRLALRAVARSEDVASVVHLEVFCRVGSAGGAARGYRRPDRASHRVLRGGACRSCDRVELEKAYGLASRGRGDANTISTQFATASATKGLTALAVVGLIEDGALELTTTARSVLGSDLPLIGARDGQRWATSAPAPTPQRQTAKPKP